MTLKAFMTVDEAMAGRWAGLAAEKAALALQGEVRRLRAEIEWRKMRDDLVETLLTTYRCLYDPTEEDQKKIAEATAAIFDFEVTHPKP
jgi:hypothetical protein